jgi:hypothetical protein
MLARKMFYILAVLFADNLFAMDAVTDPMFSADDNGIGNQLWEMGIPVVYDHLDNAKCTRLCE